MHIGNNDVTHCKNKPKEIKYKTEDDKLSKTIDYDKADRETAELAIKLDIPFADAQEFLDEKEDFETKETEN